MSTTSELPRTPTFRLDGQKALVTGAGRGIGLAATVALAEHGAHVVMAARSTAEIEMAAGEINRLHRVQAAGGKATPLPMDVTDLSGMQVAIATHGPFDILVNNAGTNRPKPLLDVTIEDFDVIFGLNVRAAYFVAQAVARGLIAAGRPGSIINMSSQMGHVGAARRTVYCASKHAMEGMTKAMAMDLALHQIRVNSIGPTFIETPLASAFLQDPAFRESVLTKIKLGRIGKVEDLMGAIVYLASPAAGLVTGTSLVVDGGWTAE